MTIVQRSETTHIVVERLSDGGVRVTLLGGECAADELGSSEVEAGDAFAALVSTLDVGRPRWVWDDTRKWYPRLLAAGVRVARSHDLRLSYAILRGSAATASSEIARGARATWGDEPVLARADSERGDDVALFDVAADEQVPTDSFDAVAEIRRQLVAVSDSASAGRLRLLLAAESAGALIACEMASTGLPWSVEVHDSILTSALGPRPRFGGRPEKLEELASRIRAELGAPMLNPDSPIDLMKALRRAGVRAESTRSWELKQIDHPSIPPLLEYKKRARLLSANGWAWMDEWIDGGRFRPDYVVGGVVTGRWATDGGGALQLPRQVRSAVVADPGWKLVVADAAQLEPRILTAMSGDLAMARAGTGKDLYQGIVDSGVIDQRAHAKVAMLGAMYGATTGESGRLMPSLARAYPRAIALVEAAARAGEQGEIVSSWLGRSSPAPSRSFFDEQSVAFSSDGSPESQKRARSRSRDWGRFTRNFIVQSTAAEWALCWMADLRHHLWQDFAHGATVADSPHLVYFLHDEVIVHTPATVADEVAKAVETSAATSGRSLFGGFPGEFPVNVAVVDSYDQAK